MDEFKKQNQELHKTRLALLNKFKKQGLSKNQVEIKIMQLDIDFLIHSWVNQAFLEESSIKKRLDFYIKILKTYYETE